MLNEKRPWELYQTVFEQTLSKCQELVRSQGGRKKFAVVTEGKTSEIKVARTLRFAPGTILAIDRGYVDYEWFRELTQEEVYFVTRMKEKAVYERASVVPARGDLGHGEAGVHRVPLQPAGLWDDHRSHLQGPLAGGRVQSRTHCPVGARPTEANRLRPRSWGGAVARK
ncbi:MAG: hypothetical protein DMG57_12795 [Acidobacteria bacterium]|nr:MAG: hypothetical protein DMG57_12795 [Acidobacteriota bacterium]